MTNERVNPAPEPEDLHLHGRFDFGAGAKAAKDPAPDNPFMPYMPGGLTLGNVFNPFLFMPFILNLLLQPQILNTLSNLFNIGGVTADRMDADVVLSSSAQDILSVAVEEGSSYRLEATVRYLNAGATTPTIQTTITATGGSLSDSEDFEGIWVGQNGNGGGLGAGQIRRGIAGFNMQIDGSWLVVTLQGYVHIPPGSGITSVEVTSRITASTDGTAGRGSTLTVTKLAGLADWT